jgi:hypothetical protein
VDAAQRSSRLTSGADLMEAPPGIFTIEPAAKLANLVDPFTQFQSERQTSFSATLARSLNAETKCGNGSY